MFFTRSVPLKPVSFIFDENMTRHKCLDVCKDLTVFNRKEIESIDLSNTYTDLEIFNGVTEDTGDVINNIDYTSTFLGRHYLENIIKHPVKDIDELKKRQEIARHLAKDGRFFKELTDNLDELKKLEKSVLWTLKKKTHEEQRIIDSVYFQNKYLKMFNENESVMTFYNYFRIVFSPVYGLLSPVLFLLIPYFYLRYITRVPITFMGYFRLFKASFLGGGIPNSAQLFGNQAGGSGGGMRVPPARGGSIFGIAYSRIFSILLSTIFYIQNVLNSIEISKRTHEIINEIHSKLNDVSQFYSIAYKVLEDTKSIFSRDEMKHCMPQLTHQLFKNNPGVFTNKGMILISYLNVARESKLNDVLSCIGEIDFFASCSKIIDEFKNKQVHFCYPEFLSQTTPYINMKEVWHPYLDPEKVVPNDIIIGDSHMNLVITGPNAGGKSTFIKSATLALTMAQTLGIAPCSSLRMTPFTLINTYLNIPDVKGKESLFEAEMHRARDHINKLDQLPSNHFSFLIMDEIFSSTNPEEGISGGYAICEKLGSMPNSMAIITTHFSYLTKLEETSNFKCYKIPISRGDDNEIVYNYKLLPGVSKQYIALELLRNKGFDKSLVSRALELCDELNGTNAPVEAAAVAAAAVEEVAVEEKPKRKRNKKEIIKK
jgi:DNA mismatch repair protein MutS